MDAKPEPKIISEVCTLCGLDWKRHGKDPTSEKCIELLLSEVRSLNAQLAQRPFVRPWLYPVPYVPPYTPRPYPVPYWQQTWGTQYQYTSSPTSHTPRVLDAIPQSGVSSGSTTQAQITRGS